MGTLQLFKGQAKFNSACKNKMTPGISNQYDWIYIASMLINIAIANLIMRNKFQFLSCIIF
jgi:hypothetical protein